MTCFWIVGGVKGGRVINQMPLTKPGSERRENKLSEAGTMERKLLWKPQGYDLFNASKDDVHEIRCFRFSEKLTFLLNFHSSQFPAPEKSGKWNA